MGLKCLLGHDFGAPEVEREQEVDGNEMVVTEREVQTCTRCGKQQVLSENTEVTAIRTPEEVGMSAEEPSVSADDAASEAEPGAEPSTAAASAQQADADATRASPGDGIPADAEETEIIENETTSPQGSGIEAAIEGAETEFDDSFDGGDPGEEDAVILDEAGEERAYGEWPDSSNVGGDDDGADAGEMPEATADDAAGEPTGDDIGVEVEMAEPDSEPTGSGNTPATEDAEILDDSDDEPAWPDHPDTGDSQRNGGTTPWPERTEADEAQRDGEETAWPEQSGSDEGFSAEPASSDGPDISFGNGLTPEMTSDGDVGVDVTHAEPDGYETSYTDAIVEDREGDGEIISAGPNDGLRERATGVETEYYCPNCEHSHPTGTSLRPGDICPDCQFGYIAERER